MSSRFLVGLSNMARPSLPCVDAIGRDAAASRAPVANDASSRSIAEGAATTTYPCSERLQGRTKPPGWRRPVQGGFRFTPRLV